MVTQGPQDNPDGVRFQQASATPIVDQVIDISGGTLLTFGPFYVGNTPSMLIDFRSAGTNHLIGLLLTFSNLDGVDPNALQWSGQANATGKLRTFVPIGGNFVTVQIFPVGGIIPGATALLRLVGVNDPSPRATAIAGADETIVGSVAALGAGAVSTTTLPRTLPGEWQVNVISSQPGIVIDIEQQFLDTVWTFVGGVIVPAATIATARVFLAPVPARLNIQNTAAAAAAIGFTMISAA